MLELLRDALLHYHAHLTMRAATAAPTERAAAAMKALRVQNAALRMLPALGTVLSQLRSGTAPSRAATDELLSYFG